jgi:acyl-CoA reductase-like NAD-dependent aldehyde dehydrogenase
MDGQMQACTGCFSIPFGGVKNSGIGVEFNVDGLREYTTVQVLNVAR